MKTFHLTFLLILSTTFCAQDYSKNKVPCESVVYPLQFYFVHDHPLRPQRNISFLYRVRDTLNAYFKPYCIQFQICKIDTIHDYNYFILDDDLNTLEKDEIRAMHYNPKAINIYWVNPDNSETFKGICEEKSRKPFIFMSYTNFTTPNKTNICVQMFRYFGLPYTASTPTSIEFVNRTNSLTTADSIWDTPADPGSISFPLPDTFILPLLPPAASYVYTNRKDPNGDYYNPMVLNPMSIYNVAQKQPILTHEQAQKLIANERMCRKRFWEIK